MSTDTPVIWAGRAATGTLTHGVVDRDVRFAGSFVRGALCRTLSPSSLLRRLDRPFSPLEEGACTDCIKVWSAAQDSLAPGWTKECASCGSHLPINHFAGDARTGDGFARRCLACVDRSARERKAARERAHQTSWQAEQLVARIDRALRQVERINAWQLDPAYPTVACRFDNRHPPVVASLDAERADVRLSCPECGWSELLPAGLARLLHAYRQADPETLALLKPGAVTA